MKSNRWYMFSMSICFLSSQWLWNPFRTCVTLVQEKERLLSGNCESWWPDQTYLAETFQTWEFYSIMKIPHRLQTITKMLTKLQVWDKNLYDLEFSAVNIDKAKYLRNALSKDITTLDSITLASKITIRNLGFTFDPNFFPLTPT